MFLAADAKRYEELDDAVRQYLAWTELAGTEERIRELELPPQQAAQARKRLEGRRRDRGPADLGHLPAGCSSPCRRRAARCGSTS